VVIGANCKIGPNCYLRGHASIGDGCHIGQSVEIKNCLILSRTNVGHLSYVGDSVLGEVVQRDLQSEISNLYVHKWVGHQYPCVHPPAILLTNLLQTKQESLGVFVVDKDTLASIATGHHMIDRSGIFKSQLPSHVEIHS
jgi:NDP-sugar pyrophosphorylase family protein